MSKFEVYRDASGQYRWRLKAGNGEIVAISEAYTTKSSAKVSAQRVKELAYNAIIVELV